MFNVILRFLMGYVTLKISGDYPERFLNLCSFNGIKLWNIRPKGKVIYANISVKDYFKVHRLKVKSNVSLKITAKKGIYFLYKPYAARKGILIGIILFFAVNILLSRFAWNITVVGNKKISDEKILATCREIGIYEGCVTSSIDTNEARLQFLLKNEDLSWVSFNIEGSHITVNVTETKKKKQSDKSPSNLVAKYDAEIIKAEISSGAAMVKTGDAVLKGDILATGTVEYANGNTELVKCKGTVTAKTIHTIVKKVPYFKVKKVHTGKVKNKRILTFFGCKIPLSFTPEKSNFDKKVTEKVITKNGSYLPFSLINVEMKEYKHEKIKLSKSETLEFAKHKADKFFKKKHKNCKIIKVEDKVKYTNDGIELSRNYICNENIEREEKIKFGTVN